MKRDKSADRRGQAIPSEQSESVMIRRVLDLYVGSGDGAWCHVPNETEGAAERSRKVAAGLKRGVPDYLIFDPPPMVPEARGVAIEAKRLKGGRVSGEQERWLEGLAARGWLVYRCDGWREVRRVVKALGYRAHEEVIP